MGNIWEMLGEFEDVVYTNEKVFIKEFCIGDVMSVISVSFNSSKMKYVYIQDSGQHIADEAPISDFLQWYYKNKVV